MNNPEILSLSDSGQGLANDPQDALINRINGNESNAAKLAREGNMVGQGVVGAAEDMFHHADQKVAEIVSSVMAGGGLGALAEMGTPGRYLAAAAGVYMVGKMAVGELTNNRWSKFGAAWSDNWSSSANMAANIATTKDSLGSFVVDTGLSVASFKLGGLATRVGGFSGAMAMEGATAPSALGRALSADLKLGDADVFARASEALKKPAAINDLSQLGKAVLNGKMADDATVVSIKGELGDLVKEHQGIKADLSRVTTEIHGHATELSSLKSLLAEDLAKPGDLKDASPEMRAVRIAQDNVQRVLSIRDQIPAKEAELRQVESQIPKKSDSGGQQEGGRKGPKPKEDPEAAKAVEQLRQKQTDLKEEIRNMRQDSNDNALTAARVRVAEAQKAWQQAREAAPARVAELEGADGNSGLIGDGQVRLNGMQTRSLEITGNISQLLDKLDARRAEIKQDIGLVDPVKVEPKPRFERRVGKPQGASDTAPARSTRDAAPRDAGKPPSATREVVQEAPVAKVELPPEVQAKNNATDAYEEANSQVRRFSLQRDLKTAKATEARILSGEADKEFATPEAKATALEQARVELAAAQSDMQRLGPPKYAQTVRSLRDAAAAAEDYLAKEPSDAARTAFAKQSVEQIEGLMRNVDNIYKGVNGQIPDLRRINLEKPFEPMQRLSDIRAHLDKRMSVINNSQRARIDMVINNPVMKELMAKPELVPPEQAVLFFEGGKIVRASDNSAPLMIDGHRLAKGVDTDGAGLHRFIGHENIEGGAVIKIKKDGQGRPIPLRGSSPDNPKYVKEVVSTVGTVPDGVEVGDSLGELMKRFGDRGDAKTGAKKPG